MTTTSTSYAEERSVDPRALVEPALRAAIDSLDDSTRLLCGYHVGFWDADGNAIDGGGKGVRPALAVLSALAAGAPAERGVPAAVACELVHNFSLLHDDAIDGDTERRHRPTVWWRFGLAGAILAGDALLSLANEVLGESDAAGVGAAVRSLNVTVRRLVAGQASDVAFEKRSDVSRSECLAMSRDKTAALIACSASLGAVLVEAPPKLILGLEEYGDHVGMAFQLTDDLLGIWGDPARTGKPVGSDLRSRKKSVPVVVALTSGTPAGQRLGELYTDPEPLDGARLAEATALVDEAGGRSWTETEADRHLTAGVRALDRLDLSPAVRDDLARIAYELRGRDR